jgi:4'-phosphopantetheinyl transferase
MLVCDLTDQFSKLLDLLKPRERTRVLGYLQHKDRKLCLGSYLLKYLAISKLCDIPWTEVEIGEGLNHKPIHLSPLSQSRPLGKSIKFNVSHQAGLVALIACNEYDVGIDIVCIGERGEEEDVQAEGFEQWLKTYEEVFSSQDIEALNRNKDLPMQTRLEARSVDSIKLRRFCAYWALKEAFVKMTGEALMADWLKDTEFESLRAPDPSREGTDEPWGETIGKVAIRIKGVRQTNVSMKITAFEDSYMIAMSARIDSSMASSNHMNITTLEVVNDILAHTTIKQ